MLKFLSIIICLVSLLSKLVTVEASQPYNPCAHENEECVTNLLEPHFRQWILKGQPDKGIQPLEPIVKKIPFYVNDVTYTLQNVNISGFEDMKLISYNLRGNVVDYVYNFDIKGVAEKIISDGYPLLQNDGPFSFIISNVHVKNMFEVCYKRDNAGVKHFEMVNIKFDAGNIGDRSVSRGYLENIDDDNEFNYALAQAVGLTVHNNIFEKWVIIFNTLPSESVFVTDAISDCE